MFWTQCGNITASVEQIFSYDIATNYDDAVQRSRVSRSSEGCKRGQDSSRGCFSVTHGASLKSREGFATASTNVLTLHQINIAPNEVIEDEGACLSTRVVSTASNYSCLVYRGGCFNQIMSESKVIENTSLTPRRQLFSHITILLTGNRYVTHTMTFFHMW